MMKRFAISLIVVLALAFCLAPPAAAEQKKPVDVVIMTTPFGTGMYNVGAAFEQVFKKAGSWVHIKHQETPGAMYMYKYMIQNLPKMKSGEVPQTIFAGGTGNLEYLAQGRQPFDKLKWPTVRSLVSNAGLVGFYVTMDPNIKSLKDLAGKRVGTAERARPFLGVLLDQPLFGNALGIYDKIDFAPLGDVGAKDAFLNGKLDAVRVGFGARMEVAEDGSFFINVMAPAAPTMEILSSGKKILVLPIEREWTEKGFDFSKDQIVYPALIKQKALPKILKEDIWARAGFMCLQCDASLPDDIVEEIVRVRHEHRQDFGKYHAALALFPSTPYPIGGPRKFVHPGVIKAMNTLGLPIPRERD
ncbi:MAG: ABC transporter substrate-binding protein [Proteobacteria bacterium]|nr:ABC transporter substrate-binding protein [Pseudomonadota bacterium]